jgi:hypothetical protein
MAVNALRIGRIELIDGQICHTMVQYGDSTVYLSSIGDRHLRYPGTLRSIALNFISTHFASSFVELYGSLRCGERYLSDLTMVGPLRWSALRSSPIPAAGPMPCPYMIGLSSTAWRPSGQGLTPVHFSAQLKRFSSDRGVRLRVVWGLSGGVRGCQGVVFWQERLRLS